MSVPRRRVSKSRTARRKAGSCNKHITVETCSNCGRYKLPHRACIVCGYYKADICIK